MNNTSINELNAILKGEHMAISGYEKYIQDIKNPNIKGELQNIQKDHKQHATKVAERIQNLGGKPVQDQGLMGKAQQVIADIKDIGKTDDKSILKDALNGEEIGIKMAWEVVKGDLDGESKNLVNEMLNTDKNHLNTLSNLMNSAGTLQ